jgi:cell division protein FtsB
VFNSGAMNVNLGIWGTLTRIVIVLLIVAGMLAVGFWYLPLIRQNERMRKELQRLDAKQEKEKELNRQYKSSVESLQNDPKAIERLARERLGYAKPGETVVRFEQPETNQFIAQ